MACTTIHQSYNIRTDRPTSLLCSRVVSFGLSLMGTVQELPKNCNFFYMQAVILVPTSIGICKNLMPDNLVRQVKLLLILTQRFGP